MKRIICSRLLLLVFLLLAVPAAQARLVAQVDREQMAPDETLNLTLSRDGGSAFSSVDLQPLEKDFTVLGRSQSSSTQFVNGSLSSSFSLNLALAPKRTGLLTIPPLTVGGESSQALTVKVLTQPQPKTRADNAALFLESEVDSHAVDVQEQVLLTLRIYVGARAQINEPETPQLANALVEKLADSKYIKAVNGRNYEVFERKYAIFPQKSGVLDIPPLRVRAAVPARSQPPDDFFGGFFGAPQQELALASNPEKITVREKSGDYPAGAAWLPTSKLTVAVDWSREPKDLRVGDSATVTIGLSAQGLLAAQLPPLDYPDLEGVKIYQGKGELQNLTKGDGVIGVRKESIAIIPTRPGTVLLPEMRIPWWNKDSHKVEYAIVPAQHLVAKGSALAPPPGGMVSAAAPGPAGPDSATPEASAPGANPPPAASALAPSRLPLWLAVGGGMVLLAWLVTLYLLLKTRRQLAAVAAGAQRREEAGRAGERAAYQNLAGACRSNNAGQASKAFWTWVRIFRAGEMLQTTADLARVFPDSGLVGLLEEIDRTLYGAAPAAWQGQGLLAAVETLRKTGPKKAAASSRLPPLYR